MEPINSGYNREETGSLNKGKSEFNSTLEVWKQWKEEIENLQFSEKERWLTMEISKLEEELRLPKVTVIRQTAQGTLNLKHSLNERCHLGLQVGMAGKHKSICVGQAQIGQHIQIRKRLSELKEALQKLKEKPVEEIPSDDLPEAPTSSEMST